MAQNTDSTRGWLKTQTGLEGGSKVQTFPDEHSQLDEHIEQQVPPIEVEQKLEGGPKHKQNYRMAQNRED